MAGELQSVHARAVRSAFRRADELARRQFAAISRSQLLSQGNSRSRIAHWLAAGRLHPKHPGVYAWGREELSVEGEHAAALLLGGPGSALTGVSALWWLGLLHRRPWPIRVATPTRRKSASGVRFTHRPTLLRRFHRGLPVVPLPEALPAATRDLSRDSLRLVLARAEYERLLDRPSLEAVIRSGRPGAPALRAAVDAHLPALAACVNDRERDFVLLCERHRLPIPEPNTRIGRYRPDMLWRDAMLIVELDGVRAHSSPAQLAADARKQVELERLGYAVLRFTHERVASDGGGVAAAVRGLLPA
jgi:hypothetical protein